MRHHWLPLLALTILISFCVGDTSAQWYPQNSGTTKRLNDVVFLNEYTGIAVGDSGLILRTTNGGTLWSVVPTIAYNDWTTMSFVDGDNGWVAGRNIAQTPTYTDSAVVLRTTDGGLNWYVQAKLDLYMLNDVFFVDQNVGFIVDGPESEPDLYRTLDGGETWSGTTMPSRLKSTLYFADQNTGWILSGGCGLLCTSSIYKTTDGGNTWVTQMDSLGPGLNDISFTDSQNGIAVGKTWTGVIYRTTDGGTSWTENLVLPFGDFDFIDVIHISNSAIAAWGMDHNLGDVFYWSTDSGVTWQLRDSLQLGIPYHINRMFFTDTSNGWAVGDNGIILHTTNGGVTSVGGEGREEVPTDFALSQNYPNPFNPSTTISYDIPTASIVELSVFNTIGQRVATLANGRLEPGRYQTVWDASGEPSGVYFYRLTAGSYVRTNKMLLVK